MSNAFRPPVFIIGCPRSGTTLLYHILLSAGDFAIYRSETNAFNIIGPKFGDLRTEQEKKAFLVKWFGSYMFTRTGLDRDRVESRTLKECRNTGDFLRMIMEEIAMAQGVNRWAECTPEHALYLDRIATAFPDAVVIHMVRDGRDAGLSLAKLGWIRPLPWDRGQDWVAAGLFWKWIVQAGRRNAARSGLPYLEVRFEDLVARPVEATARISAFIGQKIDYDHVRQASIGSVGKPNTSFGGDQPAQFNPVGRWKDSADSKALENVEATIGDLLCDLGYDLATANSQPRRSFGLTARRLLYPTYFGVKQWVKGHTPLSRYLVSTAVMEAQLPPTV